MSCQLIDPKISAAVCNHQVALDLHLGELMDKNKLTPKDFIGRFSRAIFAARQKSEYTHTNWVYEVWVNNGTPDGILISRFTIDHKGEIEYDS